MSTPEDAALPGEVWQEADGVLLLVIRPGVEWRDFNGHQVPWGICTIARPLRRLLTADGTLAPEYEA